MGTGRISIDQHALPESLLSLMLVAILIAFTLFGHAAIWVGIANRLHALSVPQWFNKTASFLCHGLLVGLPIVIAIWQLSVTDRHNINPMLYDQRKGFLLYYFFCWFVAVTYIPRWIFWRLTTRTPKLQLENKTTIIDVAKNLGQRPTGNGFNQLIGNLPGNEIFRIHLQEKQFLVPALPPELDRLTIAHLSDFHLSGRIGKAYYEEVVRITNDLQCDIIALTGDLFDGEEFLDWIPDTFAKLTAKHGVYFILGNHDARFPCAAKSRELLTQAGLIDLSAKPSTIEIDGRKIYLAGNERPWFPLSPMIEAIPGTAAEPKEAKKDKPSIKPNAKPAATPSRVGIPSKTLRVLLSHSPDQFAWAREHRFDLMLAGHTHGGQIRLPLIGAIYSPSWHGVRLAGGTFFTAPTLLHVTRGVGSDLPLRFRCPPEIARLVLRAPGPKG